MSFTLNGIEYDVSYVGDCDINFSDPSPGSELTVSLFGDVDTLTRPYKVKLPRKNYVQNQLSRLKGRKDFEYAGMALTSWTMKEEGAFVVFNVIFKGCFDGKLPLPKFSGGFTSENVTLPYEGGAAPIPQLAGTTVQVAYKAPFITVEYVSRGIPTKSQFPQISPVGDIDIEEVTGATENDIFIASRRATAQIENSNIPIITGGSFRAGQVIKVDGPNYTQAGIYYECTETRRVQLRPLSQFGRITFQAT